MAIYETTSIRKAAVQTQQASVSKMNSATGDARPYNPAKL
jgi:hypothetical protein